MLADNTTLSIVHARLLAKFESLHTNGVTFFHGVIVKIRKDFTEIC